MKITKHKPYWPVVGGAKECLLCGKQNYDDEYCDSEYEDPIIEAWIGNISEDNDEDKV